MPKSAERRSASAVTLSVSVIAVCKAKSTQAFSPKASAFTEASSRRSCPFDWTAKSNTVVTPPQAAARVPAS